MTTTQETRAQRRAREAQEAQIAAARWNEQKHSRLLRALARAQDLGVDACVYHRNDVMYYKFNTNVEHNGNWCDPVAELMEHVMEYIEQDLEKVSAEQQRARRLAQVRQDVLSRLTEEQKEALGLWA
jgi:hypothetical protein